MGDAIRNFTGEVRYHAVGIDELTALWMSVESLKSNSDDFFLLVMACLIFFMHCGFGFLEAGSVRNKNTTNILMKNVVDTCLGAFVYWAVGYAFAFGPGNGFIGCRYFFFKSMSPSLYANWFFHFVFAATATTIVSGAMAERTEFVAYLIYSVFITGFVYPVVSHWAWSKAGWLAVGPGVDGVKFHDFAGSGVVHMVGGTTGLMGAIIVGPRIGRFVPDGKPKAIPGYTIPLVTLGGFMLFFGFFAFNGGSQASISRPGDGQVVSLAIVNTILSGGHAGVVAMVISKLTSRHGQWSLLNTINGALTGMVAICAGCNVVAPWGAAITGLVAGGVYNAWSWLICRVRIDDPLDAVAVHLGGGLWGLLSVPIFSFPSGILCSWTTASFISFGWNLLGAVAIAVWTGVLTSVLFGVMRLQGILRVSAEVEQKGLDIVKHGEPAYPLFSCANDWSGSQANLVDAESEERGLDIDKLSCSLSTKTDTGALLTTQVFPFGQEEQPDYGSFSQVGT